jgi:hypothetical protein
VRLPDGGGPPEVFPPSAGFLEAFGLVTSGSRSSICVFLDATAKRMPCDLDHPRTRASPLTRAFAARACHTGVWRWVGSAAAVATNVNDNSPRR